MKTMKKFASLLVVLALVMSLAVTAFAANTTAHTITITNDTDGYVYEAYQVFKGDVVGEELQNIAWGDGVNGEALLTALQAIEAFEDCKTVVDVATILAANEDDGDVAKDFADVVAQNLSATKAGTSSFADGKYTIPVTGDGYYFIKSTTVPAGTDTTPTGAHTRYILKVVQDVIVAPKGSVPSVEKKIVEDGVEKDYADFGIGDTVNYRLTATLPAKYEYFKEYKLVFHDTLSDGLTYNDDAKVYVVNGSDKVDVTTQFTREFANQKLTVSIDNLKGIASVSATSKIVVEYSCVLNTAADIGNPGNDNKVKLEYSNDPNHSGTGTPTGNTPEDKVIVFTYELDVDKVDGVNGNPLKDAEFVLFKKVGETNQYYKFVAATDEAAATVQWVESKDEATVLKSDEAGKFVVQGLDAGTYYLEETEAPEGYNKLDKSIELVISANVANGKVEDLKITVGEETKDGNNDAGTVNTVVKNNSGAILPGTGGIGTTIFYVCGGIMVLAAVVLLVTKRRMHTAK